MAWGFTNSSGQSLTAGVGTWRFYDSSGNLLTTLTTGSGSDWAMLLMIPGFDG